MPTFQLLSKEGDWRRRRRRGGTERITALRINVVHHMQRTETPSCAQFAITPHLE